MNTLIKYDPFEEMMTLQRRVFGDDFPGFFKNNTPTTDVYTKDNQLIVEAHLPKFNQDDIDIQIDGGNLVINAQKHEQEMDKDKKYVVRESSDRFYRSVPLPERADTENIAASLNDGVLNVTVPLTTVPEPKRIAIK